MPPFFGLRPRIQGIASIVALVLALRFSAAAEAQDRDNCLFCHAFPGLSRLDPQSHRIRLFYIDPAYTVHGLGPHARLACTDCHARDEVAVVPHQAATPVDCARTCHLARPDAPPRIFSHEGVSRLLEQSAHRPEVLRKLEFSGGPLLEAGQALCLYCHDEPVYRSNFHQIPIADLEIGRCNVCHTSAVPLDSQYFLRHVAARLGPSRPTLEQAQVCAVCHSDPKVLAASGKNDPVASYVRSFHGKAALLGDETTASCVACHVRADQNAHLMVGPNDPQSAVYIGRIADSCRSIDCHPGADKGIAATAVHLDLPTARGTIDFLIAAAFILITVLSFGPSACLVLLELWQLVIGRHSHAAEPVRRLAQSVLEHPVGRWRLVRFTILQRVQHWLLSILFLLLVLTGFPLKFADQSWASMTIHAFGGLSTARALHHAAGVALLVGFAMHLLNILRGILRSATEQRTDGRPAGVMQAVLRLPVVMNRADLVRTGQLFAYLLGLRRHRPTFGRFSAAEKFEYFGVLWGTTLLGVTGIMLWGEQITSQFLGGRAFNLATIMHTYEAFLALIHVGILHIYNVILAPAVFPLSLATLTGHTPVAKLAEENGEFVVETARQLDIPTQEAETALALEAKDADG